MNEMTKVPPAPIVWKVPADAQQLTSVPKEIKLPDFSHQPHFKSLYLYHTIEGNLAMVIARYEEPVDEFSGKVKKKILPFTVWQQTNGSYYWCPKNIESSRPLFNLRDLIERPNAPVILTEGEKCAEAVRDTISSCVSITWAGGSNTINLTDFAPLKGRDIMIMPDHDTPGYTAASKLKKVLLDVGASRVRVLDIAELGHVVSEEVQQGYDIADAIRDGLTSARLKDILNNNPEMVTDVFENNGTENSIIEAPECEEDPFLAYLEKEWGWTPNFPEVGYNLSCNGLYKHSMSARGVPISTFVGSPIAVVGQTRPLEKGQGWGRIVAFTRPDGVYEVCVLQSEHGAGDGREWRKYLAQNGFQCPNDPSGRLALADYISHSVAPNIVDITYRPGWVGDSFALPQGVISPPGETRQIKLDMDDKAHFFACAGDPEDWTRLASLAELSSRAMFALSVAFAAVLLKPMGESGGGFHLYGQSSRSKTTLLVLAGSTFGGGGIDGFVQSWLRTGNSAEAAAADHNDCPIMLDEQGLSDPELASDLYYMLANGHGKGRATVVGTARASVQWRVMTLSSGECSSVAHMRTGSRGTKKRFTGGVAVRMVDIPVEASPGHTFEDIGHFESEGLLAEHIGREARRVYGHAGPAFIKQLVVDREAHLATARQIKERFIKTVTEPEDDPQVKRIAGRFGVVAAAGSLATQFGVLPWQENAAFDAAVTCYTAWKNVRGTTQSEEERDALRALRRFFELYGRSRFEAITPPHNANKTEETWHEDERPVRDRCGYRTTNEKKETVIYVTPEAFRSEVCDGHNANIMLRVARDYGALILGDGKHLQKNVRLPGHSGTTRVYAFMPHMLNSETKVPAT